MLYVCIKYSICDLISDVISCVFEAVPWVKSMYDKIMIENQKNARRLLS